MKRIIVFALVGLIISLIAGAETFKAPTKQKQVFTDTITSHNYELNDSIYPIYKTKNGKFYIWKTSKKTGNKYRQYLPKEIQEQINKEQN